jgi:hypothetical protein
VNEMLVTTEEDVQRGESSKPGAADGPLLGSHPHSIRR